MEIEFREDFDNKLCQMRIKDKFIEALKNECKGDKLFRRLDILKEQSEWAEFIQNAFEWSTTTEGFKYWEEVSNAG
jgi:hypothetical protein